MKLQNVSFEQGYFETRTNPVSQFVYVKTNYFSFYHLIRNLYLIYFKAKSFKLFQLPLYIVFS